MEQTTRPDPPFSPRPRARTSARVPSVSLWSGALLLSTALASPAGAAAPELLADLKTEPAPAEWVGSSPRPLAAFGLGQGTVLMAAEEVGHGREPWVSDGSPDGTRLLADLCPGTCSSSPTRAAALGARVLFDAGDRTGRRLWISDGTDAGTRPLVDGTVQALRVVGGTAYFVLERRAGAAVTSRELWATDGTREGTRRVLDLCEDSCSWHPVRLEAASGILYFVAQRDATGIELWRSDGTGPGSRPVGDLCPGPCSAFPGIVIPFDGRLFFVLDNGMPDSELFATDPTGSSASPVASLLGGRVSSPAATDAHLFFVVDSDSIWVTDGTPTGTGSRVAGNPEIQWVHAAGEALYFADEALEGFRLWRIEPGDPAFDLTRLAGGFVSGPDFPAGAGGQLFFVADDGVHGRELWATGGPPQSTRRLSDIPPGELLSAGADGFLAPLGDRILFQATDREHGSELWVSDGTAAGTRLVRDLAVPRASADPRGFSAAGGLVHLVADGDGFEGGLWRTDGSPGSVELLDDSTVWQRTVEAGGRVFAVGGHGRTLGLVDGDRVEEIATLAENRVGESAAQGGSLFFGTKGRGQELWISDGTAPGTRLLVDVNPDWVEECAVLCPPIPTYPSDLTVSGGRLFFVARSPGAEGPELWVSDGSASGTRRVTGEIAPAGGLAALGSSVVLVASDGEGGPELWVSDGTAPGTEPLTDLASSQLEPREVVVTGDRVLFTVRDAEGFDELWRTDGTPTGTLRIGGLRSGGERSRVRRMVAAGEGPTRRVYLVVENSTLGLELWTSDGTAGGTGLVRDLRPGRRGSSPQPLGSVGDRLLFAAAGSDAGTELWITGGTAATTRLLADVAPGRAASSPSAVAVTGGRAVFAADDGESGRELWTVPLSADGEPGAPPPPEGEPLVSEGLPGFRVWVRITAEGVGAVPGTRFQPCIPETLCVAGRLPDRAEVFVRIVGPKPNGRLWPTLVKFTTSTVEVWIEQTSTGDLEYYLLQGASPGVDTLPGLFDRDGFEP